MVQKREHFLPYSFPLIGKGEIQEAAETLKSGRLSKGPKADPKKAAVHGDQADK